LHDIELFGHCDGKLCSGNFELGYDLTTPSSPTCIAEFGAQFFDLLFDKIGHRFVS
jgi:hypothetical protein